MCVRVTEMCIWDCMWVFGGLLCVRGRVHILGLWLCVVGSWVHLSDCWRVWVVPFKTNHTWLKIEQ